MWWTIKRVVFSLLRIWLGVQWLEAGVHKIGAAAWTGEQTGAGVAGFAKGAIAKAVGEHPAVQGWYANFLETLVLPNAKLFGYMVAYGETLVGVALILGMFTGFAAAAGMLMNLNFMLAGSTSINPILYTVGIIVLAGIVYAQYYGVDTYLRPRVDRAAGDGIKRLKGRLAGSAA